MSFSADELKRYARHLILKDVGGAGQQKLKDARVLVVGAGGLGAPVLMYLAAAGVGTLGIIDNDIVDPSNLQRQIIHSTGAVGRPKTESAAETIKALNPHVKVELFDTRITADNAIDIISQFDIVADGCDNFATRFVVSDACFFARRTLVSAAVGQFDGQLSTFKPYLAGPDGRPFPSYRTLHPNPPRDEEVLNCAEAGIIGALTGIVGSMQAMEVIKEILQIGNSLAGQVLLYDALGARTMTAKLNWNQQDPLNGENPSITSMDSTGQHPGNREGNSDTGTARGL